LPLDKRHQHIKAAPAEANRPTIEEELAAMRRDPEVAEFDDRRRFGRKIHSRGQGHLRGSRLFQSWKARERICMSRPTFRSIHPIEGGLASPEQSTVSSVGMLDRAEAAACIR
jgi:hypothetical protein